MKDLKPLTMEELEDKCNQMKKRIKEEIRKAKEKIIYNWDKGRDGREFIDKIVQLERGYKMFVSTLENNRGLVISWNQTVVGIDNWGKVVHTFNAEEETWQR